MNAYRFAFDFDSTLTKRETLPYLASLLGKEEAMGRLTEHAMAGGCSFEESFRRRASLLSGLPLPLIRHRVREIPLNPLIAAFVRQHAARCYIVTGNLDLWISEAVRNLGMEGRCLASHGIEDAHGRTRILSVLDKGAAAKKLPRPFVAVGDGSNDIGMLQSADIGVAFAGVRPVPAALRQAADHVFDKEEALCAFLRTLL